MLVLLSTLKRDARMKIAREVYKNGTCECGGAVCFNCWQCVLCTGHMKDCSVRIIAEKEDQESAQLRKRLLEFKKALITRMEHFDECIHKVDDVPYTHSRELGYVLELLTEYFGDLE